MNRFVETATTEYKERGLTILVLELVSFKSMISRPEGMGLLAACAVFVNSGVFAGSVLTNGLPAGDAIVNINARLDGAAAANGDQSLWYRPFNATNGPLLQLTVVPGTYAFRVINPADAAAMFPLLTPAQTNQMYAAWTYNNPWILNYLVFDGRAATNASVPQLFDGDPEWPPFSNPNDAYHASILHGTYDVIRAGPQGRDSTNLVTAYTFSAPTDLIFAVPDYGLGDNAGGVSVLITPARPTLSMIPVTGTVELRWATNAADGYLLEATDQLVPAIWQPVNVSPVVEGSYYTVPLANESQARFFRLRKP